MDAINFCNCARTTRRWQASGAVLSRLPPCYPLLPASARRCTSISRTILHPFLVVPFGSVLTSPLCLLTPFLTAFTPRPNLSLCLPSCLSVNAYAQVCNYETGRCNVNIIDGRPCATDKQCGASGQFKCLVNKNSKAKPQAKRCCRDKCPPGLCGYGKAPPTYLNACGTRITCPGTCPKKVTTGGIASNVSPAAAEESKDADAVDSETVRQEFSAVRFLKHNVRDDYDDLTEIALLYRIKLVPAFAFFKDGSCIGQIATRNTSRVAAALATLLSGHKL
ncbi:unnamed protein product [Closterium sp. NIES-53]